MCYVYCSLYVYTFSLEGLLTLSAGTANGEHDELDETKRHSFIGTRGCPF